MVETSTDSAAGGIEMTTRTLAPTRRRSAAAAEDASPVEVEDDVVDIWGHGSFPASDPPANW
jgi:hypothetical protein